MNVICPSCRSKKNFKKIPWNDYRIYMCKTCELFFCKDIILKEEGGDSSPVDNFGIEMMKESYFHTKKIAQNYAKKRVKIYEGIIKTKCKKILEVGCGPGVFSEPMKKLKVDWKGIEINPLWIDFGKQNKLPISNEKISDIKTKFDVVCAHQVIEHVEDPITFLDEIRNSLKRGGILHLELPNHNSFTSKMRRLSPKISYDFGFIQPPMHMRAYTNKSLSYLIENNGFKIEKMSILSNNDQIWGQVRNYSLFQKIFFNVTGMFNQGSLLVLLATKK